MISLRDLVSDKAVWKTILGLSLGWLTFNVYTCIHNLYFHPLSRFPGPRLAASTVYWKGWIECILMRSWHTERERLHAEYGPIVRVGPNEMGQRSKSLSKFRRDESSFGYLTYAEAKTRKDVLNKNFSAKAITNAIGLVQDKVDQFCRACSQFASKGDPIDISWGYKSMTVDIITYYCFGRSIDAMADDNFSAPIIVALEAAGSVFNRLRYSSTYRKLIQKCPRYLSRIISPSTAGLVDLQELIEAQIRQLLEAPEEQLSLLPQSQTIYHSLMDKEAYKAGKVPSADSLYHEAQAMMFAGTDTVGTTLMLGTYYMLKTPGVVARLKVELASELRNPLQSPSYRHLEKMPYLTACIKESLRMSSGAISGLPRIVPLGGAVIDGESIPSGTVVSIGSTFVHYNEEIFPEPNTFRPERWLGDPTLDNWLVAFGRGPRMCLGINLAWVELYLTLATVFRRFDMELDDSSPEQLVFTEKFLAVFTGSHVKIRMSPVVVEAIQEL